MKTVTNEIQIEITLLAICKFIGIQYPPEILPQLAIDICKYFPNITPHDVERAFKENAIGKLSKIYNHYGSFDWMFVGAVLSDFIETERSRKKYITKNDIIDINHQLDNYKNKHHEEKQNYLLLLNHIRKHNKIPDIFPWIDIWNIWQKKGWDLKISKEKREQVKMRTLAKMNAECFRQKSKSDPVLAGSIEIESRRNQQYYFIKEFLIEYYSRYIR